MCVVQERVAEGVCCSSLSDVILYLCQDKQFVDVRQMTGISISIPSTTDCRKPGENTYATEIGGDCPIVIVLHMSYQRCWKYVVCVSLL